jgi:hypothetical protein
VADVGAAVVWVCSLGRPARPAGELERDRLVRCLRGFARVEPTKLGRCALFDVASFIEAGFHLDGGRSTTPASAEVEREAAVRCIGATTGYSRDGLWALRDALNFIGRGMHAPAALPLASASARPMANA